MRNLWRLLSNVNALSAIAALAALATAQQELSNNPSPVVAGLQTKKANARPVGETAVTAQLETYKKLLGDAANDPVLLNNLGVRYAQAKRYGEAAELIEKAVELGPRIAPILVNLAVVRTNLEEHQNALDLLHRALAVDPSYKRVDTMLCDLYTNAFRHREAADCFESRSKTNKLDSVSISNFSTSLIELGEQKRAARMLREASVLYPSDPGLMNALGIALYRLKNFSESAAVFTKLVQSSPARPQFRFNLAVSQMAARNRTAAIEQYNILKRSDPELARSVYNMLFRDKFISAANR